MCSATFGCMSEKGEGEEGGEHMHKSVLREMLCFCPLVRTRSIAYLVAAWEIGTKNVPLAHPIKTTIYPGKRLGYPQTSGDRPLLTAPPWRRAARREAPVSSGCACALARC